MENVCTHIFSSSDLFSSGSSDSFFMESVSVLCNPDPKKAFFFATTHHSLVLYEG